ncbi:MAG: hypothetical protein M0037_08120 [Betaproteobacteria bacterium]|nr:hypothetical protein [Betaproteobacteria bacterium]
MPYYVYKIGQPLRTLEKIAQFDAYKEASHFAKARRTADGPVTTHRVRVIFAANEIQAEELLSEVREREPMTGEDY